MSNLDSLIEFEESLSAGTNNDLILSNLALKIECFDHDDQVAPEFTKQDLNKLFETYCFANNEFLTCTKCGNQLMHPSLYKSCCSSFVEQMSHLSDFTANFWLSFINNPTTTINTFPSCTKLFALQQAIPAPLRSIVWKKLFLFHNSTIPQLTKLLFANFQHSYNQDISKQISKDLPRTFPLVEFFKLEETVTNLSTILNVYANYDAELGYCQGLLFLVGVLYHNFESDCQMTFHALISIMNLEHEVHNIFMTDTMSLTLDTWLNQFKSILVKVDPELFNHLDSFVEFQTFLYQWWLSFISSHTPDLSIVNTIMDFCMIQGWKVGLFKISLGLLISNKPILMAVGKGDEEVIYQHLLNESKWGNVVNNLDYFFGDLLLSWDDQLFLDISRSGSGAKLSPRSSRSSSLSSRLKTHARTPSMFDKVKGFVSSSASTISSTENDSSMSLCSSHLKHETESIYSETSLDSKSITEYLKIPFKSTSHEEADLAAENQKLRLLLAKACDLIQEVPGSTVLQQKIQKLLQT